jgi:hypothetical protein
MRRSAPAEGCWPGPEHEVAKSSLTSFPQHVHEAVHPDGLVLTMTREGIPTGAPSVVTRVLISVSNLFHGMQDQPDTRLFIP